MSSKLISGTPIMLVSRTENIPPGRNIDVLKKFLRPDGPKGGRLVCAWMDIVTTLNLDSVTSGTIQGEDSADGIDSFLFGLAAEPYYPSLKGQELRAFSFDQLRNRIPEDPADQAASGTPVTMTYRHRLPLFLPRLQGGWRYCVPIDYMMEEDFQFNIRAASNSSLQQTGGYVLNASTGVTVTVILYCFEDFNFRTYERWALKQSKPTNDDEFTIPGVANRPVLSSYLHKVGASGGAAQTGITSVLAPDLGFYTTIDDEHLEHGYAIASLDTGRFEYTKDPFDHISTSDAAGTKAFPLVYAMAGSKATDLPMFGDEPRIKLGGTPVASSNLYTAYLTTPVPAWIANSAAARRVSLEGARKDTISGKPLDSNHPYYAFIGDKVSGEVGRYRMRG